MKTSQEIGALIRRVRKSQGLNQSDLAMIANTAQRFISELERGKPTCQLGKMLDVLAALGIRMELHRSDASGGDGA
ncbi:MAG: transcriptional regulator [Puniceicoccaceae bacterium]|nr:MAG: transcriptional regulator [Puniceicoccaceae bacterium]